ncbi:SET and MYND domain-containing protein 4-like isoform X2 [Neocloeon triangulifer]|uniref:SET and MYND domain-containing protein 4-like isoform X2 n=1 Tax=Neocloeon triangulifer TaxID=2078957 RepID=UPI00286EF0E3|nr:SET and MYND domain-containing protein 4-like isoform X2 [Neocloeon triangulifer]
MTAASNSSAVDRVVAMPTIIGGLQKRFEGMTVEEKIDIFSPLVLRSDPDQLMTSGDVLLKKSNYWSAIVSYNKSLMMSPAACSELRGQVYLKRSHVLLTLGFYQESISDAQLALKNNCPEKFATRLHLQIAQAKKALGRMGEAEEEMKTIGQIIDKLEIKPEAKEKCMEGLRKGFEEDHKPVMPRIRVEYLPPPPLSYGPNPEDPRVSDALTIEEDNSLVAKRRINLGDVLVVEDPLFYINSSMITSLEPSWIHCSECFKQCLNLQPCSTCLLVLYCSQECADEAWQKHHKVVCAPARKIFNKMRVASREGNKNNIHEVIGGSNQALEMLAVFGVDNCAGALVNGQVSSDASPELKDFLNLQAGPIETEIVAHNSANEAETVEMVVESIDGLDKDKKASLREFLRRAMPIVLTYTGLIRDVVLERKKDKLIGKGEIVGQGFYPRLRSVPRGCEANAVICSYLKTSVVKALRPIEAGERIFFIASLSYSAFPKAARQAHFMDCYGPNFKCIKCRPCSEDWPLSENHPLVHDFIEKNPKYFTSGLLKEFWALLNTTEKHSLNWCTPEKLDLCNRILELYVGNRRDDVQCNYILELLGLHFPTTTKRYVEGNNTVALPDLDHCLVFKNVE